MKSSKTVLITGASSGIGLELANLFAKNGYNLVLTARNDEQLKSLAQSFMTEYNISVLPITKDLSEVGSAQEIYNEVTAKGICVDILVNNAGMGLSGYFSETSIKQEIEMIQLNIIALTCLTKYFAKDMIKNKYGKILNVGSTGSFMAGPLISVYYATKAYVLSFSEALRYELKDAGIVVTALCPGATKTQFATRAGKSDEKVAMAAAVVAQAGYDGLMKNKSIVIPGLMNKFLCLSSKLFPKALLTGVVAKIQSHAINLGK